MATVFLTTEMKEAYELHELWKRRFWPSLHECGRPECKCHQLAPLDMPMPDGRYGVIEEYNPE